MIRKRSLWEKYKYAGAFSLFTLAFGFKQYLWTKISSQSTSIRQEEHDIAASNLENALQRSKKYALPELTKEEKLILAAKLSSGSNSSRSISSRLNSNDNDIDE